MAQDRFIHFGDEKPSHEQMQMVLEDYFGSFAKVLWDPNGARWEALLDGPPSFALDRIDRPRPEPQLRRWIEVILSNDGSVLDILTREMDEATNALADGLGNVF